MNIVEQKNEVQKSWRTELNRRKKIRRRSEKSPKLRKIAWVLLLQHRLPNWLIAIETLCVTFHKSHFFSFSPMLMLSGKFWSPLHLTSLQPSQSEHTVLNSQNQQNGALTHKICGLLSRHAYINTTFSIDFHFANSILGIGSFWSHQI